MSYIYAIPIDDKTIKFGSHTGPLTKLIARYNTTTSIENVKKGVVYRTEDNANLTTEKQIFLLLNRVPGLRVEGEKYTLEALSHWHGHAR